MKTFACVLMLLLVLLVPLAYAGNAWNIWGSRGPTKGTETSGGGTGKASPTKESKQAMLKSPSSTYSASGFNIAPLSQARIDELAKRLTPEEAKVLLDKGTERAFCGTLLDNHQEGMYVCRLCGLPLFSSSHKFDSGTGWPSFFQPIDPKHIHEIEDRSHGMVRTEIACARCGSHLGHVFDDGPKPTGQRHCLNSIALTFIKSGDPVPEASRPVKTETAYFAGGCFWGVEDRFQQLPGVIDAVSGYMGGKSDSPTYKQVCTGTTGHAETVRIAYDPSAISYDQLLSAFFRFHDPTQLNRQGPDVGDQYRSAIFASDQTQLDKAKAFIAAQQKDGRWSSKKIVTQVEPIAAAGKFFAAEDYHQDYHVKHGGSCALPPE